MKEFWYALATVLNEMSPYILLGFLFAGVLHVFVQRRAMARHLSGTGWKPVLKAAILGIPLPLCSCGVLPTAVSLHRQGASRGATTSFLIATPQTGVDSIAATYSLLGLPMAILRPIAALFGSMIGGLAVNKSDNTNSNSIDISAQPSESNCSCGGHCKDEDNLSADSCGCGCSHSDDEETPPTSFIGKVIESVRYGMVDMVAAVGKWLVIGLFVAALITVFMPDDLLVGLSSHPLIAMLVMVALAVPMYVCATGSIPIALSLMLKGLTPGVGFVLLMAGPAANMASVMVLNRSLGRRATAVYVGSVIVTAILFGVMIDYFLPSHWFMPPVASNGQPLHACHDFGIFQTLCSALLVGLLLYSFFKKHNSNINPQSKTEMIKTYIVKGMSCAHCKMSVEKALSSLKGCESAVVNLSAGTVTVNGPVDTASVMKAVELAGFDFGGEVAE